MVEESEATLEVAEREGKKDEKEILADFEAGVEMEDKGAAAAAEEEAEKDAGTIKEAIVEAAAAGAS